MTTLGDLFERYESKDHGAYLTNGEVCSVVVSHDKRAVLCRVQFDDIVPRKALFDMEKGIGSMYGLSRVRIAPRYQLNGLTQPYVDSLKEYIVLRKPSAQGYLTDSKWDMTANGLTVSMLGSGVEYLAHDLRQLPEMIRTETGLTCAVNTETSNEETELRLAQKTEQGREQMLKRMMHTPPVQEKKEKPKKKPVSADNEVALAGFQVFERFTYLRRGAEAAEHLDGDRKAEKALHGGLIMLLGKHRRRNEYRRLTVIENALHRRAKGDLGFAVADVAAQKTVHRRRRLHIGLYLGDAAQLIVGLRVAEVILKLALPGRIGREGVAGNAGALGVELYELACQLFCRGLGAAPRLCPLRAAHFRELNVLILGRAEIFRHHVQRSRGNVQRVCSGVADHDIILFEAVDLHLFYAREAAYAVHLVNDEVARLEVGVGVYALSV